MDAWDLFGVEFDQSPPVDTGSSAMIAHQILYGEAGEVVRTAADDYPELARVLEEAPINSDMIALAKRKPQDEPKAPAKQKVASQELTGKPCRACGAQERLEATGSVCDDPRACLERIGRDFIS